MTTWTMTRVLFALLFLRGALLGQTAQTPQTIYGDRTFTGATVFTAKTAFSGVTEFSGSTIFRGGSVFTGPNSINASNPGTFSAKQMSEYLWSILNNCNPATEWNATQGTYATDAVSGCVSAPANATGQVNAIAGYANGYSGSPVVGGFFQGRCLVTRGSCWGINPVVQDIAGLTNIFLLGVDINVNPQNAADSYTRGIGAVNAALAAPNAGAYGTAFTAQLFGTNPGTWQNAYVSSSGAAKVALIAGYVPGAGAVPSQPIYFYNRDLAGQGRLNYIYASAAGDLVLNAYAGGYVFLHNGGRGARFYFGLLSAPRDYSWPDHNGTVQLNGSPSAGIVAKQLTLASGIATFTFAAAYPAAPVCTLGPSVTGNTYKIVSGTASAVVRSSSASDESTIGVICMPAAD
jgi:hypothetical protein